MQGAGNRLRAFAGCRWAGSPCPALVMRGCAGGDARGRRNHGRIPGILL